MYVLFIYRNRSYSTCCPRRLRNGSKTFLFGSAWLGGNSEPEPLKKRGGVWFQCGAHQVHIGVQPDFVPAKKAHPAFQVQRLNELHAHLLAHQVPVIDDDARSDEGIKRFYVQDPFGNRLEFLERVSLPSF